LSNDLGINEGFTSETIKKISVNINNTDTLKNINNEVFWTLSRSLNSEEDSLSYAMLLGGGWLQSFYIGINSIQKYSAKNKLVLMVADQQFVLENLIDIFNSQAAQKTVFYKQLNDFYVLFLELQTNENEVITQKQFESIKSYTNKVYRQWQE
jgi:hypothetical protein